MSQVFLLTPPPQKKNNNKKKTHSFLHSSSDQPPTSFYLVRLISKTPCMVLRLGFPIGTPAHIRNKVLKSVQYKPVSLSDDVYIIFLVQSSIILDDYVSSGYVGCDLNHSGVNYIRIAV